MGSIPCPSDRELLSVVLGGPVAEPVCRHVEACGACRERVERLRVEVSGLRRAADELPAPAVAEAAAGSTTEAPRSETTGWPSGTERSGERSVDPAQTEPPHRLESIGRYRILGELDSGGQATVYRAVHPTLPRDLAIKIAHRSTSIDRSLLRGDAEILCELDHPTLVRVYDLDIHEGRPFVVMEFVRGRSLQQVADQMRPPARQAAAWVAQVARALEYAHRRGVVHQDIKPRNILIDESVRPRLIDFGMARWRHAWTEHEGGPSGGTLAFMAPEQARGQSERVGAASDIFALGGVLYFLLTGKTPFGAGGRDEQWRRANQCDFDRGALRVKGIPRRLERIVLKAMAADPQARYASAEDMAAALDAFLRRPRRLALQAGALVLFAAAVGGWWLWPPRRESMSRSFPPSERIRQPAPALTQTKEAASATDPSPAQPLRIESFQVTLHPRAKDDPVGLIGINASAGRLAEDVRIQARLSAPAFCFLIALNPDGRTQLCYPEEPARAPVLTTTIDYPSDPGAGFGLTDGVGTQVFILVASSQPLPSYAEWAWKLGVLPWKSVSIADVWRFDGHRFDHDTQRGEVRRLAGLPPPLEATCRALQNAPGIQAIRALAFPVEPQPASKNPQRPG
jgi:serine/threonine protein kinase